MSDRYEGGSQVGAPDEDDPDSMEVARENVFDGWPQPVPASQVVQEDVPGPESLEEPDASSGEAVADAPEQAGAPGLAEPVVDPLSPGLRPPYVTPTVSEHAPGELVLPPGPGVIEGKPLGQKRAVGIVVARFNAGVTSRLLAGAVDELERAGVAHDAITIMPVPGAFELPIAAMALAKTRRFACVVALGCVIRGGTAHFEYVCAEAASGLQLAALETGVPVAFGVLTLEEASQAEERIDKGAEAVRSALEMADIFANLRVAAAAR